MKKLLIIGLALGLFETSQAFETTCVLNDHKAYTQTSEKPFGVAEIENSSLKVEVLISESKIKGLIITQKESGFVIDIGPISGLERMALSYGPPEKGEMVVCAVSPKS